MVVADGGLLDKFINFSYESNILVQFIYNMNSRT